MTFNPRNEILCLKFQNLSLARNVIIKTIKGMQKNILCLMRFILKLRSTCKHGSEIKRQITVLVQKSCELKWKTTNALMIYFYIFNMVYSLNSICHTRTAR